MALLRIFAVYHYGRGAEDYEYWCTDGMTLQLRVDTAEPIALPWPWFVLLS